MQVRVALAVVYVQQTASAAKPVPRRAIAATCPCRMGWSRRDPACLDQRGRGARAIAARATTACRADITAIPDAETSRPKAAN